MQMENRLASCLADVHAHVIAVGRMLLLDDFADVIHGSEKLGLLLFARVEPRFHMAFRNQQRVARRNRERIPKRLDQAVFIKNAILWDVTERAVVRSHC